MKNLIAVTIALFSVPIIAACGDDDDTTEVLQTPIPTSSEAASPTSQTLSGDITVFAAASLTEAFEEIAAAFESENPETSITFNFAGSQDLRTQLEQGARADIFAAADTKQIELAKDSGVVTSDYQVFARNRLIVILPSANEADIVSLQDLAKPGTKLVLANADVPVGNYSRQFLEKASADPTFGPNYGANVLANLVSEEANVRQVAARIQLDEADAGVVYSSDVTPELAAAVTTIEIPDALNTIAEYPIAVTTEASDAEVARGFIDFVLSEAGQAILVEHNFIGAD